jgi:hypothetical protein
MAVDYTDTALSKVRLYLWEKFQSAGLLTASDYVADGFINPLVPIIPVQQVPEFNNLIGNKSYLIYDYDTSSYSDDWWVCEETVTFSVISSSFGEIVQMTQFMVDLFRRMDQTAKDINAWMGGNTNFKFFTFSLTSASSPTPYPEEGGRQMADIQITYRYSRILDSNGRFI